MTLRDSSRLPCVAAAIGCALWASGANAAPVFDLNGDSTVSPYYQVHTYSGLQDSTGSLPNSYVINEGTLTSNNTGLGGQFQTNTFTANGATVTSTTSATPGGLFTSRNTASLQITNANAADGYYALGGYGTMSTVQFFSAQARAERATFTWRVTGQESAVPPGSCVPSTQTFDLCATARIDFSATSASNPDYFNLLYGTGSNTLTAFGPGTYTYDIGGFALGDVITLGYWTSAFVQIRPGQLAQGGDYTFTSNYANTFDLVGIDLFDANDTLITDWTLLDLQTGETVFDANGRVTAAVPEPESLALLGVGLLGIGLARRRRSAPLATA